MPQTDREHLEAMAEAFNAFMHQLELGDHRDSEDHQILRSRQLVLLRDAVAAAGTSVEIVTMDDARALAARRGKR